MRIYMALLVTVLSVVPAPADAQGPSADAQAARSQARVQELVLRDGSRLYGRGVSDMKGSIAAIVRGWNTAWLLLTAQAPRWS